jgi:hypothetical protein
MTSWRSATTSNSQMNWVVALRSASAPHSLILWTGLLVLDFKQGTVLNYVVRHLFLSTEAEKLAILVFPQGWIAVLSVKPPPLSLVWVSRSSGQVCWFWTSNRGQP